MLIFVGFEFGDRWDDFLLHEFVGGLADQALVVGKIRGSEDVFRAAGGDEECAAAIENLGNGCRGHMCLRTMEYALLRFSRAFLIRAIGQRLSGYCDPASIRAW